MHKSNFILGTAAGELKFSCKTRSDSVEVCHFSVELKRHRRRRRGKTGASGVIIRQQSQSRKMGTRTGIVDIMAGTPSSYAGNEHFLQLISCPLIYGIGRVWGGKVDWKCRGVKNLEIPATASPR